MIKQIYLVTVFLVFLIFYFVPAQNNTELDTYSQKEAHRLWEIAIKAKGGRDNLYKVDSLAVTYEINQGYESTELYIFPSKHWSWVDVRPSILSVFLIVINYEKSISYTIFGNNPTSIHEDHTVGYDSHYYIKTPQLWYFLETKWYRPELIKGYESEVLSEKTDAIEIKTPLFPAIIHLSKKTHLPVLISYLSRMNRKSFNNVQLSDYKEISGIWLPHGIREDNHRKILRKLEINPPYDPAVFEQPPVFSKGPNQWRIKVSEK